MRILGVLFAGLVLAGCGGDGGGSAAKDDLTPLATSVTLNRTVELFDLTARLKRAEIRESIPGVETDDGEVWVVIEATITSDSSPEDGPHVRQLFTFTPAGGFTEGEDGERALPNGLSKTEIPRDKPTDVLIAEPMTYAEAARAAVSFGDLVPLGFCPPEEKGVCAPPE